MIKLITTIIIIFLLTEFLIECKDFVDKDIKWRNHIIAKYGKREGHYKMFDKIKTALSIFYFIIIAIILIIYYKF